MSVGQWYRYRLKQEAAAEKFEDFKPKKNFTGINKDGQPSPQLQLAVDAFCENGIIGRNPNYTWAKAMKDAGYGGYQYNIYFNHPVVQEKIASAKRRVLDEIKARNCYDVEVWREELQLFIERAKAEGDLDKELKARIEYGKSIGAYAPADTMVSATQVNIVNNPVKEEVSALSARKRLLEETAKCGLAIAED